MTTYVLGAGASFHAGYPLISSMGYSLFSWMKKQTDAPGFASKYPAAAEYLEGRFGPPVNIEDMLSIAQEKIDDDENGNLAQRENHYDLVWAFNLLKDAVRGWFAEIRQQDRVHAYQRFARNVVALHDCIITFNYDVSLDRELRLAGKLEIGDGYGFPIKNFPAGSSVRMLKLHGSVSWLDLMFRGISSGPFSIQSGIFGPRPVIGKDDLVALEYPDAVDPEFQNGGAAVPVMIMPTRSKVYTEFMDYLWKQAANALEAADRVVICGYGLSSADQRACKLLLGAPKKDAEIVVSSGNDTCRIVREYQKEGYTRAKPADEIMFEKWVDSCTGVAVT